jgi:alkanesulfonate monooxygenase SsuD/methylene tetrahydromethanopterin reductase-like flavin-dependent oxidoreductase (luciferase family)
MKYDVFFSLSQTPVDGHTPSEAQMFRNTLRQVQAADELGYGTAWFAESHLSSQVQKSNPNPVIPHWEGEVGLNCNVLQMASHVFARTRNIEVGSAVMNIICMGGPIAWAERIASFVALHGLDEAESRRLHVGFSGGRFQFMNRETGIKPRNAVEEAAWPALRGQVFAEAAEVFIRLLNGDVLSSEQVTPTVLTRANFRSDGDWERVQDAAGGRPDSITIPNRWDFLPLEIVPRAWRRELVQLIIGSHDPGLQKRVNALAPVQVFNLSITSPEKIEATHERMRGCYPGDWQRDFMPRTTFVFVDDSQEAARARAEKALSAYWKALTGTIDPRKIASAADNALVGTPDQVAEQAASRFHVDDRLMLWFDFFDHDCDRVIRGMQQWTEEVAPKLAGA